MTFKLDKRLRKLIGKLRARAAPDAPAAPPPARIQPPPDVAALRAAYDSSPVRDEPDRFVLYRIVGNDLPPRHVKGSARANVRFILEHEPPLADCARRWLLNRIVDPEEERAIAALLERHGETYERIPFSLDAYAAIGWDLDDFRQRGALLTLSARGVKIQKPQYQLQVRTAKNNYVMNNNGARNAALESGRAVAKWVMPWDGNCFLTAAGWAELREAVLAQPHVPYFVVPMARIDANRALLDPSFRPVAADEPQILFRRDADFRFDERFVYGMYPKVELLIRLGVQGPWDAWRIGKENWVASPTPSAMVSFAFAGWVARLESGRRRLELGLNASHKRRRARNSGILVMLDELDRRIMAARLDPRRTLLYREDLLRRLGTGGAWGEIVGIIAADAKTAMARGLHAVTDKTGCAPSGDKHDYWHLAPTWWPNPSTPDGLPYVERDGERRPELELYAPGSEAYDRSRLQRVLEDTTLCALAWRATGNRAFATHGAALLRRWFLARATRMNPQLRYGQVRLGLNGNMGVRTGLIEMRDLPLLLDGARLLAEAGALTAWDRFRFRRWLASYGAWLRNSAQGKEARLARNNIGTFHDLQAAAIAAYLDDAGALVEIFRRCRERIQIHFDPDGSQPREQRRPDGLHYCCFNLQGWAALARIAEACGEDLWAYRSAAGHSLRRGLEWLLEFGETHSWPHNQMQPFDWERLVPLRWELDRVEGRAHAAPPPAAQRAFQAETGIRPYWFL